MQETIRKCDRCKKQTDQLINIGAINTNVSEEKWQEEEPITFGFIGMSCPQPKHPEVKKEICIDCAKELCRWLDHQENLLTPSPKQRFLVC